METKNFIKCCVSVALILFISNNVNAITRFSANSGNWNDAGTWNPVGVPACGDSVIIQAIHTIGITNQQNYETCSTPFRLIVYGRLLFYNGSKLSLSCNSYVIVYPGGVIDHDQGFSSSNLINICGVVEWNSNNTLFGLACLPGSHPICSQVLAAELINFSVNSFSYNKVQVNWETASESFTDYFSVERSSDGINWIKITEQNAAGFSNSNLVYNAIDDLPLDGIFYYRLCIHDKDGKITFSDVRAIDRNIQNGLDFSVSPNPASESFYITLNVPAKEYLRFELYDLSGRLLLQKEFDEFSGSYQISGLENLSSGVKMLKAYDKTNNLNGVALMVVE